MTIGELLTIIRKNNLDETAEVKFCELYITENKKSEELSQFEIDDILENKEIPMINEPSEYCLVRRDISSEGMYFDTDDCQLCIVIKNNTNLNLKDCVGKISNDFPFFV